jgi:hypothetical protein
VAVEPTVRQGAWTAALALGLLAGCASPQWIFSRPGVSPARLDQDLEHCQREAHRPYWFAFTRAGRMDQEVLKRCMERRGYTARREG